MKIKHTIFLIFLLGLAVGAYAFTQSRNQASTPETTNQEDSVRQDADSVDRDGEATDANSETSVDEVPTLLSPTEEDGNAGVVNYALDLSNFKFSPKLIEAEPGQTLTIKLNVKQGAHNFIIDELGVKSSTINTGDEETITFTVPDSATPGDYEFYCGIGNHRQLGMVGTLRVTTK